MSQNMRSNMITQLGRLCERRLRLTAIVVAGVLVGSLSLAAAQTQAPAPSPKTARQKAVAVESAPSELNSDVVARVGGQDVTADAIRSFLVALAPEQQAALARDPALMSQTVRLLLANRLVLQEAISRKWDEETAIRDQLAQVRESAIAETYLQSVSKPPEDFPSDADVQLAYDANKTSFVVPRQFRIAQIYVASQKGSAPEIEEKARKKLAGIQLSLSQPKADFSALARELSDQRETGQNGGDIGWVLETQMRPEIRDQVMGLDKNAVGSAIRLDDGWHIVKLLDTKPASTQSLEDVKPLLAQRLREQRAEELRRAYLTRLVEQNPPVINEMALSRIFGGGPADQPSR